MNPTDSTHANNNGERRVALCGTSLFITGIETSLCGERGLRTLRLDLNQPDALAHLTAFGPDVIIFDSDDERSSALPAVVQLALGNPQMLFIELGAKREGLTIVSVRPYAVNGLEDLTALIRRGVLSDKDSETVGQSA
ncbi:MAG: hypothetical protein HY259_11345 [Chloroflexi bacterium]|nr:hypothetical protein [Chloroflexota bacterium]MBI3734031.1 hypothetical protein [Chloroflexota bacterium]